jgi:hypothetical protein
MDSSNRLNTLSSISSPDFSKNMGLSESGFKSQLSLLRDLRVSYLTFLCLICLLQHGGVPASPPGLL